VSGNIAPRLISEMQTAWQEGDVARAMAIQHRLVPLHDSMFAETNPGPVKYAASLLGFGTPDCRLPLAPLSDSTRAQVRAAMVEVGLMN
jgi:4-hydroxy-tetrahydrodipicolinate synthase